MRRFTSLLVAALLAGAGIATLPSAASAADAQIALATHGAERLVVDAAHGHLYIADAVAGVVVRTLTGAALTTVPYSGATDVALSPDGTRLYVALSSGAAIAAIDTTSLTEVARYATDGACPRYLAPHGSLVWFATGCYTGQGVVGVLDLSIDPPAVTPNALPAGAPASYGVPKIVLTPDGSRLFVTGDNTDPAMVYGYDAGGTTLAAAVSHEAGQAINDLAVTPDGTRLLVAAGYPYHHQRFLVSDLSPDGTFAASPYPSAVDTSGDVFAAGVDDWDGKPDIRVFRSDGSLLREYSFAGLRVMPGTLRFGPGEAVLYVVTNSTGSSQEYLHVLHDPTKRLTSITLTKPSGAHIYTSYTVTGSAPALGAGATLHVSRQSKFGTVAMHDVTTGSGGTFAIPDRVGKRGTYTYTVSYPGSSAATAATATVSFPVIGLTPSLSIATDHGQYQYRQVANISAHLGTTAGNRYVQIWATPLSRSDVQIRNGLVNSAGNISATMRMSWRTTFTAYFSGDDIYEPRRVTRAVTVYAAVRETLGGYYSTASNGDRIFHDEVDPTIDVTVEPNRWYSCVSVAAEVYYSGAWHAEASQSCFRLDSNSTVKAVLTGTPRIGYRYRIRAVFNGDSYSLRNSGAWLYLRFTT